jgi:Zn-dependent peptidase ImmA (M78 family)
MPPRPGDRRALDVLGDYDAIYPDRTPLPVPVVSIAEDLLGLRVHAAPDLGASGLLVPRDRLILINADEPVERQRFTVAHEIGHWVVHCGARTGTTNATLCRAVSQESHTDLREREADSFGAELLMPTPHVYEAVAVTGANVDILAETFAVSRQAMSWRLFNLRLSHDPESP